jgi:hypothetical protein
MEELKEGEWEKNSFLDIEKCEHSSGPHHWTTKTA